MDNPGFNSVFRDEFCGLITLKQSLGFKYEAEAAAFRRIDTFFCQHQLTEKRLSKELCDHWCQKRSYESAANHAHRISSLRVFCKYLSSVGIPAYIPPHGLTRHPEKYDAHIYTPDELERFFTAVDASLYTSGMRVSELRLAKIRDIDLANGCIRVLSGKNQKDRLVPIHPDLVSRCVELKDQIHSRSPEDEFFFMVRPGREMTLQNLYHNFRRYLDKAGIPHTGRGPRIHDFRHTYCVNLLLKWSEEGKDLLAYLPYMRTMLGHESFEETAYYLKLTSAAFPFVREHLEAAFPDIIQEVALHEHEFY